VRYCGPGLLGLGVTELIAGFMSASAGNVSAFSTVWTYRHLRAHLINKRASDKHYVAMGRWCTFIGVLISVGTAYLVQHAASIMDYVQGLFSFFIATALWHGHSGMRVEARHQSWRILGAAGRHQHCDSGLWAWVKHDPSALRYVAFSPEAKTMAEDFIGRCGRG